MTLGLAGQAIACGLPLVIAAYFFRQVLPIDTAAEMITGLGNMSALAGALAGWSSSWISQNRASVRDISNVAAKRLYLELGDLQKEIIWRWGIIFIGSVLAIACAILATKQPPKGPPAYGFLIAAYTLLGIVIFFVLILFKAMLSLLRLRNQLDEYEHKQVLLGKKEQFLADTAPDPDNLPPFVEQGKDIG